MYQPLAKFSKNFCIIVKGRRVARIGKVKDLSKYVFSKTLVVDGEGYYAVPGFIDLHIHIESSLLDPAGFAKVALKHSTTTVVSDPHEVANVLGYEGVVLFIKATRDLPLKVLIEIPSCVPATDPDLDLETAPHVLDYNAAASLMKYENVEGLGEVMDFVSVVHASENTLRKIRAASSRGLLVDVHAPQLKGAMLDAYICSGVASDHESTSYEEALEKLRRGMWIYIREGSAWRDLKSLVELVKARRCGLCAFVSDDLNVYDLFTNGHMDRIINEAVELGVDPIDAVAYVTIYPALRLRLEDHIGIIAPGRIADIVLTKKLEKLVSETVIANGKLVYYKGEARVEFTRPPKYPERAR